MSKRESLESLLEKAENKEKEYAWLEAAQLHEQALRVVGKSDFLRKGEVQERVGHCFRRAAFQAESPEEFKGRTQRALESYEKAHGLYERLTNEQKAARIYRCDAVAKYLGFWLTSDPSEKRRRLDECLEFEAKALRSFSESGEMLEYGRTYSGLPLIFWLRAYLEWSGQIRKKIYERGIEWGEKAVVALSEADASHELAKSYFTLSTCLVCMSVYIAEPEKQEKNDLEAVEYLHKAVDLSERTNNARFLGLSNCWFANMIGPEEWKKKAEEALECGERTQDNSLIAWSLSLLTYLTSWKAFAEEDPEKWKELMGEAFQFYDRVHRIYSSIPIPSSSFGIADFPCGYIAYYWLMAQRESVIEKRLDLLKKAEEAGAEALRFAESSDTPDLIDPALANLAEVQAIRAQTGSDLTERKHRLETALKFKERVCQIREEVTPFSFWNRGVAQTTLAKHKMDLADIEPDITTKQRLLEEALSSMEKGLKLLTKVMPYYEKRGQTQLFAVLRRDQDLYATLLTRLYDLLKKPEYLGKAIEASQEAIGSAEKLDHENLIAESHWNIGRAQDTLGEHMESAESFRHASEGYRKSAEKIPQLRTFYQEHASYMKAWNEIEKAKHRHVEKQYELARDHYQNAANLHRSTKRWNYLASNYRALARFEHAEDLSRRGQSEEAREIFQQATNLFEEAKKSIEERLETIETTEEKQITSELAEVLDTRCEYCLGRKVIEEAKILDRQGNHAGSSRKYALAIEKFQTLMDTMKTEPDRIELKPILLLSQAWHAMTQAEAEASSELYLVASRFFDEAKKHSADETGRVLALGHSSFCKALEAGTRFEATGDVGIYSTAKKNLEAAARYYLKAGFNNGSKYAKATHRLFDAYMYTNKAGMETDPEKKAQLYQMAEWLLETSAGLYMEAKHPEKGKQVQRLLESVKEDRQMARSLSQVLHVPTTTSTTTSFSIPTPTREKAVGLERFEHADIQANLVFRVREANVGDDIEFRIEMVNAGKTPALLVKVDETVPEGFELKEVPEIYTVEDSYINMKGKRLNPLKTEDVKVVVTPQSKGTYVMKPRILYLDETGKYKSHEPEPVTITVKELGISGWIKGER